LDEEDVAIGGASGRFDGLKDTAVNYAFALKVAGLA
jgi:oligopeptidase B